mmetsp:Transcript_1314/g.1993  ORF Transcript_1314/g.1993 Transcript_1314/m.1993 type:complete len:558 (-) Transcript_1314:70-1743(-)
MNRLRCKLSQRRDDIQSRNFDQNNKASLQEPIETVGGKNGSKSSRSGLKTRSVSYPDVEPSPDNPGGRKFRFVNKGGHRSMVNIDGHRSRPKSTRNIKKGASSQIELSGSNDVDNSDRGRPKHNNSSSLLEGQNGRNYTSNSNNSIQPKTSQFAKSKSSSTGAIVVADQPPPEAFSRSMAALTVIQDENNDDASVSSYRDYQRILEAAHNLDNVGNAQFERREYQDALKSYSMALRLKRTSLKFGHKEKESSDVTEQLLASVATSINNIGYLRQRSGGCTTDEIMTAYKDSLQIKKEILGEKDLGVGKTLNNIGSVYFGAGANEDAMKAYEEALEIIISNLGPKHLDVATVYSNIGDVQLAQKQLEESGVSYREALKIRWAQLSDHDPKIIRLLEKIAAIEMADTPRELIRQRLFARMNDEHYADASDQEDDIDFHKLAEAVKADVSYVEMVKRKMALEMIRDKIGLLRDIRRLEKIDEKPTKDSASLTNNERNDALNSVKERTKQMKEQRQSLTSQDSLAPPNAIRHTPTKLETRFNDVAGAAVFMEDLGTFTQSD